MVTSLLNIVQVKHLILTSAVSPSHCTRQFILIETFRSSILLHFLRIKGSLETATSKQPMNGWSGSTGPMGQWIGAL